MMGQPDGVKAAAAALHNDCGGRESGRLYRAVTCTSPEAAAGALPQSTHTLHVSIRDCLVIEYPVHKKYSLDVRLNTVEMRVFLLVV